MGEYGQEVLEIPNIGSGQLFLFIAFWRKVYKAMHTVCCMMMHFNDFNTTNPALI